jgi:hypothetical protein
VTGIGPATLGISAAAWRLDKAVNRVKHRNAKRPVTELSNFFVFMACPSFSRIIELRINKGTIYLSRMGRGDFSRPDAGRLKPPLPETNSLITSPNNFTKLNSKLYWIEHIILIKKGSMVF